MTSILTGPIPLARTYPKRPVRLRPPRGVPGCFSPDLHFGGWLMKKMCMGAFLAILTLGVSAACGQDAASDLKALDAKLTDAFKAHDIQKLGKHLADGYILVDPRGGVHGKKKYLEHLTNASTTKIDELSETDVKVRVFGDTAIVTGLLQVKGKFEEKAVNAEYRWTRVYNKTGDEWQCVLEQHTHVLPKGEAK
jgi:ketosteroid isomerase-like protein